MGMLFELICYNDKLHAQPFRLPEEKGQPTQFGNILLREGQDFRLHLFGRGVIDDRTKRGVICFVMYGQLENKYISEHPAKHWQTVEDALRGMSLLDRIKQKPQIRVIQKNVILQSSTGTLLNAEELQSGYSAEFLQQKLNAGDVIILLPIAD